MKWINNPANERICVSCWVIIQSLNVNVAWASWCVCFFCCCRSVCLLQNDVIAVFFYTYTEAMISSVSAQAPHTIQFKHVNTLDLDFAYKNFESKNSIWFVLSGTDNGFSIEIESDLNSMRWQQNVWFVCVWKMKSLSEKKRYKYISDSYGTKRYCTHNENVCVSEMYSWKPL